MKIKKSIICLFLAAILLFSVTACSKGQSGNSDKAKPDSSQQKNTGDHSKSSNAKKPKLKILTWYAPDVDINNDPTYHDVVERTGYDVEYFMLPADNPGEKLNLEVSGGTVYDILKLAPIDYSRLVSQGIYAQLDDVLATHGKNILNSISEESFQTIRKDGKTYGIPQITERPNIDACLAVRQDILDELSLPVPTDLDEFYNMLKTIKQKKPDMIPYTSDNPFNPIILSAFDLYDAWPERNGEITWYGKLPQMKKYLTFMKKLYDEGLLDKDFSMNKSDTILAKFTSGKAAVMPYGWLRAVGTPEALQKNVPEGKISLIFPLKDENGKAGIVPAGFNLNNVSGVMKKSPNIEHAVSFMDAKLDPRNFTFLTLGEEGVTYKVEDENKYRPIMPEFTKQRGNAYAYLNGFDEKIYPDMWLARIWRDPSLGEAFETLNNKYDQYAVKPALAYMPTLPAEGKYIQSLNSFVWDTYTQFIMGVKPMKEYDSFLDQWENQGGKEITKERNEWYQEQSKTK